MIVVDDAAIDHVDESLRPNMRTSLRSSQVEALDMEFAVSFLGTGGGSPSRHRNASCTALRLGGQTFLFDVCEGTQRQMTNTTILPAQLNKIFITHLHGDHLYGLTAMLLNIQIAAKASMQATLPKQKRGERRGDTPTIEIYGPPGLYNYITMTLALSCTKLNYLNVVVNELVGGRNQRGPNASKRAGRRNVFLSRYPEFDNFRVQHRYIERGEDGTWTIDSPEEVTRESLEKGADRSTKGDSFNRLPNDVNSGKRRRFHIKAAELDHLHGVQTFGFTVEEQKIPMNIDPEKATALGVQPGRKYSYLKCGLSVPTDDGTGEVHPHQVITGEVLRPRKFALLGDHRRIPELMAGLCANADVLVHEATLMETDGHEKAIMRGHTTAANAGSFGKKMGCQVIALNHFGNNSDLPNRVELILAEARKHNGNASRIVASFDFMELFVPRGGFKFNDKD